MKPNLDLSVYGVLDPGRCRDRQLADMAAQAARGGATLIQLRAKAASTRHLMDATEEVRRALEPFAVPLLINDRVDVALAVGGTGVHLGAEDMPADVARRLLGTDAIIGVTVRSAEDVEALPVEAVDYASIGGVFATASKDNPAVPVGLDGLAHLRQRLAARAPDLPVCAIAGIDHRNAADVVAAGAHGVAVISDIFMADDVEAATRRLRTIVEAALGARGRP